MKLHVSRYCLKPNDEIKNFNCAGPSFQGETGPMGVHSDEQYSDTNRLFIESAFLHSKNADFKMKSSRNKRFRLQKPGHYGKKLRMMLK